MSNKLRIKFFFFLCYFCHREKIDAESAMTTIFCLFCLLLTVQANIVPDNGNFCTSYNLWLMTIDIQVNIQTSSSTFGFRAGIRGGLSIPSNGMCIGNRFQLEASGKTQVTPASCLTNIMQDYRVKNLEVMVKRNDKIGIAGTVPMFGRISVDLTPCVVDLTLDKKKEVERKNEL